MTLIKLRLEFLFADNFLQTFWNIFGGLCTQDFYPSTWRKK